MKFLVDAQLPLRLARYLREAGHDVVHTRELPNQNATPDSVIIQLSIDQERVVITKDAEQKRIVEKVDELMVLCDRLQQSQETQNNLRQKLRESAIASLMNAETDEELQKSWAIVRDNWQTLSQKLDDVDDLRRSVLQLAVRGKLVSQSSGDEPASILLERIRSKKSFLIQNGEISKEKLPGTFIDSDVSQSLPRGWSWTRLGYILTRLRNGISKPPDATEGLKVLRISALRPNSVNLNDFRYLEGSESQYHEYALDSGDLLFTRYSGNKHFVGICGVIPEHSETFFYPDKLIRGCLIESCSIPEYISLAINTGFSRAFIEKYLKTTAGQVGIAGKDLKSVPIPLPPLAEQKRIVAKVDELMQMCDQLEESLRQSQQRLETLAASAMSHLAV